LVEMTRSEGIEDDRENRHPICGNERDLNESHVSIEAHYIGADIIANCGEEKTYCDDRRLKRREEDEKSKLYDRLDGLVADYSTVSGEGYYGLDHVGYHLGNVALSQKRAHEYRRGHI
ncbi:hypothetical protein PMAYCL1PPCAC_30008, partial [Pristionchus mayeri]